MGKISIYNTATAEHSVFTANGQLKDIFPDIDFKHSLCLKAGNRVDGTYEVQPEDVLFIRKVPGTLTTLAIAAVAIAVVGVGIWAGTEISKNKAAMEEMEKAQRDAQNLAQQSQQLPNIRGARNKNALGNPVQFVMGSVYNTPYNLTNGFYSIQDGEGTNEDGIFSFYNAVFSAGYGPQKITEVLIGNERIASDEDGISGVVEFDSDSLYYNEDADNRVEVRQPGANMTLDGCNQKVTSTYALSELKHDYGEDAVPVIVQAGENALTIQVCIQFNALRQYDSENEVWEERIAEVNPYWSNDGGSTWHLFDFDGAETRVIDGVTHHNIIERNSNHTLRFVAEKTFTAAESFGKNISIKVEKATPKMERNSQEDCSLLWYQTWSYDAQKSTSTTLEPCLLVEAPLFNKITKIAYRIEANDNTQDMLDELHCMSEGQARTWDGEDWSETKEETRNAGAWLLEVLTTPLHSPSKYEDAELDMASFGALYEYCEENDFYCDGILTAETSKKNLVEKILLICNSTLIINQEGLLEVCIDKEEDTPVALLNAENISGISYNKSLAKRTDGSKVTFTNRESWTVDTFYSMLDGGSYNYQTDTVDELALDYVTTHDHAYKIAQRRLRQQQLQPTELKADVGSEGDYYPLYSTVLVQVPQLLQGLRSSVIKKIYYNTDGEITAFDIQDLVNFVSGSNYGIVVQGTNDYGFRLYSLAVTGTGSTRRLTLAAPLAVSANAVKPELGNHLSFGLLDSNGQFTKVTKTMKIYGIEPNRDKGITLTLRDYNEDVYEYGTIPDYVSNITMPQKRDRDISVDDLAQLNQKISDGLQSIEFSGEMAGNPDQVTGFWSEARRDSIHLAWSPINAAGLSNTVKKYIIEISKDSGNNWSSLSTIEGSTWDYHFNRGNGGDGYPEYSVFSTWRFRIKAENIYGKKSANWTVTTVDTTNYGTWIPAVPSFTLKIPSEGGITFNWNGATGQGGRTLYGTQKYTVTVKYEDIDHSVSEITLGTLVTNTLTVNYDFDRASNKDGYPEVTATANYKGLNKYKFTLSVENESGGQPVTSTASGFV